MTKILVCIDDTDNLESRGTGHLASLLAETLEKNGWGRCERITRHQMLIHPDISYTSHNSSMCFTAEIEPGALEEFTEFAQAFLQRESAPGSDPGLCIVNCDSLGDQEDLIAFGKKAKVTVLTKEDAYGLAERLNIHLSEHGGTGLGVIGSLAGCGLRLTGNDGRFRGHFYLYTDGGALSVAELRQQTGVDIVKSLNGGTLTDDEKVCVAEKVKAVLQDGKSTLFVFADCEAGLPCWRTCTKQQLKHF